jgi:hypothetical protein
MRRLRKQLRYLAARQLNGRSWPLTARLIEPTGGCFGPSHRSKTTMQGGVAQSRTDSPNSCIVAHRRRTMIEGVCHCGSVRWHFTGSPKYATSCNCTLCRRWGALWAYGFIDEEFRISGVTRTYLRDPKTIEFHFCPECGCVAFWRTPEPGKDGRIYGAVNLRLAEPGSVASVPVTCFDGLDKHEARPKDGTFVADILWS